MNPVDFDYSGGNVCTEAEFQWLTEAMEFVASQDPCGRTHDLFSIRIGMSCPSCKAAV